MSPHKELQFVSSLQEKQPFLSHFPSTDFSRVQLAEHNLSWQINPPLDKPTASHLRWNMRMRVYDSCVSIYAPIFMQSMNFFLVFNYYLMSLSLKFHKDLSFRWGDIALFVTLNNMEVIVIIIIINIIIIIIIILIIIIINTVPL